MKLLAPLTAIIAAASAGQIFTSPAHSAENYAQSAEVYQSGLEYQQQGLYSDQSHATKVPQEYMTYDAYHSRPSGEKTARILGYSMENNGHQYKYAYETENGIKAEESGELSEHGTTAHGGYSYTGDDGHVYTVTYTADEHGFHPQGDHLPTPPPIPEAIQKSLEQNARDEAAGIFDDGKYKEYAPLEMAHGYQQEEVASYKPHGFQSPTAHASGSHIYQTTGLASSTHGHQSTSTHAAGAHGYQTTGLASHGYQTATAHASGSYSYPTTGLASASHGYQAPVSHVSAGHGYQAPGLSGAHLAYHAHH